jgi:hypothetical protein
MPSVDTRSDGPSGELDVDDTCEHVAFTSLVKNFIDTAKTPGEPLDTNGVVDVYLHTHSAKRSGWDGCPKV